MLAPISAQAQQVGQKIPEKVRILFLLDGSGSMLARWGNSSRIETAKEMLTNMVDSLRVNDKLELGLRVYGHLYSKQARNCKDTRLEVGFSVNNHQRIIQRLEQIKPKGTTPIAYSIEQAAADFPDSKDYRNIVIIITDGIESCDGDPCAVSLALQKQGVFLRPFIIGLGLGHNFNEEFDCIGDYHAADDLGDFKRALDKAIKSTLEKTTVSVEILDEQNHPRETNVNVSFVNRFTGISTFDFVHYLDQNGQPDSVEIDPVLDYDIIVNTIPPATKKGFKLTPGRHNIIKVKAPQGSLRIKQKSASSYPNGVQALIKKKNTKQVIHVQNVNSIQQYLSGEYDIELLTVPKIQLKSVSVEPSRTKNFTIPAPGILNLYNNASGYGSIYQINEEGKQAWVYDLDHDRRSAAITLQPGKYKVVFRVDKAPGSKYTAIKTFEIREGQSNVVKLFAPK
ncbi:MAG: VWA domain-containing protein [Bacteroidota bacterium]